jgi:thiamine kinase-like enzyme
MGNIASVEDIIKKIDIWDSREVRYETLSGGITNHNYLCTAGGKKYVLRIPGAGTNTFINREYELSNSIAAARAGVFPEILGIVKSEGIMVIPFIEGETLHTDTVAAEIESPDSHIVKIISEVRRFHAKAVFDHVTDVFDMTRKYIRMARDMNAFFPDDFGRILSISEKIEKAMERDKPAATACHNDLLPENFIIDPQGKLWILDWEYGGMNDPYFDLGDFVVEHSLSAAQQKTVIETYCGEYLHHRFCRMMLHRLTADLWWCQWAMIQDKISKIDFDFYTYGLGRYSRFRDNCYSRDFNSWIEAV